MSIIRSRPRALGATAVAACTTLVAALALTAGPAQAADVELQATIHGAPSYHHAHGSAEYDSDHGVREIEVHLHGVARLSGHRLVVRVHGTRVGTMTVSRAGTARLERHHGVPPCSAGDVVRVRTTGGSLVGSGTLRRHHDPDD